MRLTSLRVLVALATILSFSLIAAEPPSVSLEAEAFQEMVTEQEGMLLDVRTPQEYLNGHIAGAKLLNIIDSSFAAQLSRLPKDRIYYVYCRSGARGAKAAQLMRSAGLERVYELNGGLLSWRQKNLPLCSPAIQ